MKLHLDNNIAEGTPEELVEYLRLVEAEGSNPLFSFGHAHQPDEDTLKSLVGSLVTGDSYTDSTESSTDEAEEEEIYNDVYDKGAFYIVTEEASESALPVGAILQHQHGRMFRDSQGNLCIISNTSYVNRGHVNGDVLKKERFELAKQLGIQLKYTTDFAVEAKGKYFKVTEENSALDVGDVVTISEDDKDDQPLCKDEYGNLSYAYLHDLELVEDAPMGYTFWYIDGTQGRNLNVLKATLDGDFEDSTGTRYTYQAVSGLIKPLDKNNVRVKFDDAENRGALLKYYPTVDVLVKEY